MSESGRAGQVVPKSIGRYEVNDIIGLGAMGAVYKAFDPLIKRTLAIKTLRVDISRESEEYQTFIKRFYREARISGALSHPNIVTLFDIGELGSGVPFLVMEFVEGDTLEALLEKGQRFKPESVVSLIAQMAAALDYAHGRGVIHRDIKPSNLMLYEGDRIKITDFGIAKLVGQEMTQAGQLLGTPSYMSPEQAMGEPLDGRSDIFSLGVVAFEMMSGEQPFPGKNVTSILYKLVHADPVEPPNLEMSGLVPQTWHEVFGKVLAKKPAERYQTAAAFVHGLESCLGGGPAVSEAPPATVTLSAVPEDPFEALDTAATHQIDSEPAPSQPHSETVDEGDSTAVMKGPPPGLLPAPQEDTDLPPTIAERLPPVPPPLEGEPEDLSLATVAMSSEQFTQATAIGAGSTDDEPTLARSAPMTPLPRPVEDEGAPPTLSVAVPAPTLAAPPREDRTVMMGAAQLAAARKRAMHDPEPAPTFVTDRPEEEGSPHSPDAAVDAPSGWSSPLVWIGVAALAAVIAGVAGLVYFRGSFTDAPTAAVTTTSAPTHPGVIRVETRPTGAGVRLNGEDRGRTPLELQDLPTGEYEVVVALDGHATRTEKVSLSETSPRAELMLALAAEAPASSAKPQPTPRATGRAEVRTTPPGAEVRIGGELVGKSPISGHSLPPGTHDVEVSLAGHSNWAGKIEIVAGRTARVQATLERTPAPATLAVPTPPPVDVERVYLNTQRNVDTTARKVSGTAPTYPADAPSLKSGDEAAVAVSFVVGRDGGVSELEIVESGGDALDKAMLDAVRTWKYEPATKGGVAVKVKISIRQRFRAG